MCDIMDSQDRRRPSLLSAVSQNMTRLYEPCHDEPNLRHFQIHRPPAATLLQINFTPLCAGSFYFIRIGCVSLKKDLPFEVCLISPFWFFRKFCQKNLFFFFQSAFPKRKVGRENEGKGKKNFRKKN